MTLTANIYEISAMVIALAVLIFVIVLIPTILQIKRTIKAFEDLSVEGKRTMEGVNLLVKKVGEQAEDIEELVKKVKEVGIKITGIVDVLVEHIRNPIVTFLSVIFGIQRGWRRFVRSEKNEGGEK